MDTGAWGAHRFVEIEIGWEVDVNRVFGFFASAIVSARHERRRRVRPSVRQGGTVQRLGHRAAACCAGLLFGLVLAPVRPASAAALSLSATIVSTGGAFDNDFFPQVGQRVECQPTCATQESRNDAVPASILSTVLNGHQNFGDASMFIDVSGRARVGDLGLSVSGYAGGAAARSWAIAEGSAQASWRDVITITTNAVPIGEQIVLEATLNLFGILDAIAAGEGSAAATLTIQDLGAPSLSGGGFLGMTIYDLARSTFVDIPVVDFLPVRMTLTNGARTPIGYLMSLGASALSDGDERGPASAVPGSANVSGIAIDSLHWGGIQRITDRSGNALGSFSVSSDSGFDFARPFANSVAEPSAMALMLAALGAGFASRRRRASVYRFKRTA